MSTTVVLAALAFALHVVVAIVLLRRYLRSRDVGFIWLGIAVLIWPFVSNLLNQGQRVLVSRFLNNQPVGFLSPVQAWVRSGDISVGHLLGTLAMGQQLIGIILLLCAVLYLSRTNFPAHSN
jgi:hypothetical protein